MKKQLYGLFERPMDAPKGSPWTRLYPNVSYRKDQAVRVFQSALLEPFFEGLKVERSLRPVKTSTAPSVEAEAL